MADYYDEYNDPNDPNQSWLLSAYMKARDRLPGPMGSALAGLVEPFRQGTGVQGALAESAREVGDIPNLYKQGYRWTLPLRAMSRATGLSTLMNVAAAGAQTPINTLNAMIAAQAQPTDEGDATVADKFTKYFLDPAQRAAEGKTEAKTYYAEATGQDPKEVSAWNPMTAASVAGQLAFDPLMYVSPLKALKAGRLAELIPAAQHAPKLGPVQLPVDLYRAAAAGGRGAKAALETGAVEGGGRALPWSEVWQRMVNPASEEAVAARPFAMPQPGPYADTIRRQAPVREAIREMFPPKPPAGSYRPISEEELLAPGRVATPGRMPQPSAEELGAYRGTDPSAEMGPQWADTKEGRMQAAIDAAWEAQAQQGMAATADLPRMSEREAQVASLRQYAETLGLTSGKPVVTSGSGTVSLPGEFAPLPAKDPTFGYGGYGAGKRAPVVTKGGLVDDAGISIRPVAEGAEDLAGETIPTPPAPMATPPEIAPVPGAQAPTAATPAPAVQVAPKTITLEQAVAKWKASGSPLGLDRPEQQARGYISRQLPDELRDAFDMETRIKPMKAQLDEAFRSGSMNMDDYDEALNRLIGGPKALSEKQAMSRAPKQEAQAHMVQDSQLGERFDLDQAGADDLIPPGEVGEQEGKFERFMREEEGSATVGSAMTGGMAGGGPRAPRPPDMSVRLPGKQPAFLSNYLTKAREGKIDPALQETGLRAKAEQTLGNELSAAVFSAQVARGRSPSVGAVKVAVKPFLDRVLAEAKGMTPQEQELVHRWSSTEGQGVQLPPALEEKAKRISAIYNEARDYARQIVEAHGMDPEVFAPLKRQRYTGAEFYRHGRAEEGDELAKVIDSADPAKLPKAMEKDRLIRPWLYWEPSHGRGGAHGGPRSGTSEVNDLFDSIPPSDKFKDALGPNGKPIEDLSWVSRTLWQPLRQEVSSAYVEPAYLARGRAETVAADRLQQIEELTKGVTNAEQKAVMNAFTNPGAPVPTSPKAQALLADLRTLQRDAGQVGVKVAFEPTAIARGELMESLDPLVLRAEIQRMVGPIATKILRSLPTEQFPNYSKLIRSAVADSMGWRDPVTKWGHQHLDPLIEKWTGGLIKNFTDVSGTTVAVLQGLKRDATLAWKIPSMLLNNMQDFQTAGPALASQFGLSAAKSSYPEAYMAMRRAQTVGSAEWQMLKRNDVLRESRNIADLRSPFSPHDTRIPWTEATIPGTGLVKRGVNKLTEWGYKGWEISDTRTRSVAFFWARDLAMKSGKSAAEAETFARHFAQESMGAFGPGARSIMESSGPYRRLTLFGGFTGGFGQQIVNAALRGDWKTAAGVVASTATIGAASAAAWNALDGGNRRVVTNPMQLGPLLDWTIEGPVQAAPHLQGVGRVAKAAVTQSPEYTMQELARNFMPGGGPIISRPKTKGQRVRELGARRRAGGISPDEEMEYQGILQEARMNRMAEAGAR